MSFLAALATGAKLLGGVSTLVNAGTGIYNALKGTSADHQQQTATTKCTVKAGQP
jgi:hypothetical protein